MAGIGSSNKKQTCDPIKGIKRLQTMDEWMDGWMDEWMDGLVNRYLLTDQNIGQIKTWPDDGARQSIW